MGKKATAETAREASRTKISMPVKLGLLMEAGYKCGNPVCHHVLTLELHHIQYVSDGGGDEPENLLVLCPNHHTMHHAGLIPLTAVRHWKRMLMALNKAFDRAGVDLLLFLWETKGEEIWYSGDGLLRFAALIAAGLVKFTAEKLYGHTPTTSGFSGSVPMLFHGTSYELGMKIKIQLTEKGEQLVQAWREGDEKRYEELITAEKRD